MKLSGIIYITLMLKLYSAKALANSFVHGFVAYYEAAWYCHKLYINEWKPSS